MIILSSDYSPQAAGELQEAENIVMVFAALHCAGLDCDKVHDYRKLHEQSVAAYNDALGDPDEEGKHTDEQWDAAVKASKPHMEKAVQILISAGITIENTMMVPENPESEFHHINTKVYAGFEKMEPMVLIQRPVIDVEADTYENNKIGWGELNVRAS